MKKYFMIFMLTSLVICQIKGQVYDPDEINRYNDFINETTNSSDEELIDRIEELISQVKSFAKKSSEITDRLNKYNSDGSNYNKDYKLYDNLAKKFITKYNLISFNGYVESRVGEFAILTNETERIALKSDLKLGEEINKTLIPIEGITKYVAPSGSRLQLKNYSFVTDGRLKAEGNAIQEKLNFISQEHKKNYLTFVKDINQILSDEIIFFDSFTENPDKAPALIRSLSLNYPEIAKRAGIEGTVEVLIFIDEQGEVVYVHKLKGIGAGCDEVAIDALMKSRFQPGIVNGDPVKVKIIYPVNFKLM